VRGLIGKVLAFWRWLCSPEALPAPGPETENVGSIPRGAATPPPDGARRLGARLSFWRWLAAGETILSDGDSSGPRSRGFLRWVLSAEDCPVAPARTGGRHTRPFLGWLFSPEKL
jgi:hypothetical protein